MKQNNKPVIAQDVIQVLKTLGLNINQQTGGFYCPDYLNQSISKNNTTNLFTMKIDDKNIPFLSSDLFLSTIKTVESALNYKLFS